MRKEKGVKVLLVLLLCIFMTQIPGEGFLSGTTETYAASAKSGLKKEKGKYYYYSKGKKVKNTWKTVKKGGKSYRYYFSSNGAAYAGKTVNGVKTPAVKTIKGKKYAFDVNGRMIKGVCVIKYKFYHFHPKTGVYDAVTTKALRNAAQSQGTSETLRSLLKKYAGNPKKTSVAQGCFGDGMDVVCYYSNFVVNYYKDQTGKEIVLDFAGL